MRWGTGLGVVLLMAATAASCDQDDDPPVRMNHIQVLSTHNSYKIEPEPALLDALRDALGPAAEGFEYSHEPLDHQLEHGVRHFELDVFVDHPEGGRYADPKAIDLLDLEPMHPDFSLPGLKALHAQEVDYRSTCPLFTTCLEDIQQWSAENPAHLPVTIQVELKDDEIPDPLDLDFVQPLPWTADDIADLEDEILGVFSEDHLIMPGDLVGDHANLRDAVQSGDAWPALDDARGKVMFTLDNAGAKREMYRTLKPDLAERIIFVDARPPDADAAITVVNDPIAGADEIQDLANQGLLVRTRADADTVEAREGDTSRRTAAWESGAHFVSTDYIAPDDRFGTGYLVEVPGGGVARCNPVVAPDSCDDGDLTE